MAENIQSIIVELKSGMWKPQPYLRVEIPKKSHEVRRLGLLTIKDKVIQQAIKMLIEPKFEATFFPCNYGYRKEKGALRAVKRTLDACRQKKLHFALKLDIDNYFDNIDHAILQKRVEAVVKDAEIVRLIMLCTKMGVVSKQLQWTETTKGVPQGAVLSPLLANLYLNSFDQCMMSKTDNYIRYADDFVLLCKTEEEAATMQQLVTNYLKDKLLLSLNKPITKSIDEGFEFLGVVINRKSCSITDKKKSELIEKIQSLKLFSDGLSVKDAKNWEGITRYYYSHHHSAGLLEKLGDTVKLTKHFVESADKTDKGFVQQLMAQEAQCALNYWAYVKDLLSDDNVGFDGRDQQGAVDVVNVMLNYGYALLYARVWRALLGNGLNPYDSVIHARQSGKPTFVYDVVELFRAQAVDRVVFSLVQKRECVSVENG